MGFERSGCFWSMGVGSFGWTGPAGVQMGTREGIPGVRFMLVHIEEWHFSVNKRVLCTIGVVVLSRSTEGLLLFFAERSVFIWSTQNGVVYE